MRLVFLKITKRSWEVKSTKIYQKPTHHFLTTFFDFSIDSCHSSTISKSHKSHRTTIKQQVMFTFAKIKPIQLFSSGMVVRTVRNSNLRFNAGNYHVKIYPFYPTVVQKKGIKETYEIASDLHILAFTFLSRETPEDVAWANRKSITLKFQDLKLLLSAEMGKGRQVHIESEINSEGSSLSRIKTLILSDDPKQQQMNFTFVSEVESEAKKNTEFEITGNMSYLEYRTLYKLLEGSLLELSGWKLMMDLSRASELQKIEGNKKIKSEFDDLL